MKKSAIFLLAAPVMLLALSSCNLFTKTVKAQPELPSDRETVAKPDTKEPYRSVALEKGEISGEWAIQDLGAREVAGEMTPFLMFDAKTGRFYGNNSCNTINGTYTVNAADSTLRFSNVISTMRACNPADLTEQEINMALNDTRKYAWSVSPEFQYTLSFLDADGKVLMNLRRQDFDFLNGTWQVVAINGSSVDDPDMKFVIDMPELKLHGNTGCNIVNGSIVIDMTERNSISFQSLQTTRMACPDAKRENELLVALEDVMYARPVSATQCCLLNGRDHTVLDLVRVN